MVQVRKYANYFDWQEKKWNETEFEMKWNDESVCVFDPKKKIPNGVGYGHHCLERDFLCLISLLWVLMISGFQFHFLPHFTTQFDTLKPIYPFFSHRCWHKKRWCSALSPCVNVALSLIWLCARAAHNKSVSFSIVLYYHRAGILFERKNKSRFPRATTTTNPTTNCNNKKNGQVY